MVTTVLSIVLAGVLLAWLRFALALRQVGALPDVGREPGDAPPDGWPTLSVVVACRNEEAAIREALASVLAQDYPGLEVVAVNDRSEDATGAILADLAKQHAKLRVLRVDALPAGWLGKTHALQRGADHATGEWVLFTDADVVFASGALRRAIAWAVRDGLAHAVALPHFVAPGLLERSFVSVFAMFFLLRLKVNEIGRPDGEGHIGFGAFNLVRRDAYQAIGGHTRLRFEVVDDVKLGFLLWRSGARQGCADSGGTVRVRWQRGFVASMRGLLKNYFAGYEYRWRDVLRSVLLVALTTTFPAVCLVLVAHPVPRLLAAAAFAVPAALQGITARRMAGGRGYEGLLLPLVGICLSGVGLVSAVIASARGAVIWRGTRYDLRELRASCVREAKEPGERVG